MNCKPLFSLALIQTTISDQGFQCILHDASDLGGITQDVCVCIYECIFFQD